MTAPASRSSARTAGGRSSAATGSRPTSRRRGLRRAPAGSSVRTATASAGTAVALATIAGPPPEDALPLDRVRDGAARRSGALSGSGAPGERPRRARDGRVSGRVRLVRRIREDSRRDGRRAARAAGARAGPPLSGLRSVVRRRRGRGQRAPRAARGDGGGLPVLPVAAERRSGSRSIGAAADADPATGVTPLAAFPVEGRTPDVARPPGDGDRLLRLAASRSTGRSSTRIPRSLSVDHGRPAHQGRDRRRWQRRRRPPRLRLRTSSAPATRRRSRRAGPVGRSGSRAGARAARAVDGRRRQGKEERDGRRSGDARPSRAGGRGLDDLPPLRAGGPATRRRVAPRRARRSRRGADGRLRGSRPGACLARRGKEDGT